MSHPGGLVGCEPVHWRVGLPRYSGKYENQ
jgi:hypothetical protein